MARTTMADLIARVRDMTQAGTAEYSLGTANYWDDDHVQAMLDARRVDIYREPLTAFPKHTGGGSISWFEYRSSRGDLEATDGGTALFVVEDSLGADAGTALWSADYQRGVVTFAQDTAGTAYFLRARTYDVHAAAADLLTSWAARVKLDFDFSADNQSFKRSQKAAMLLQMAEEYRRQQWPQRVTVVRSDLG